MLNHTFQLVEVLRINQRASLLLEAQVDEGGKGSKIGQR